MLFRKLRNTLDSDRPPAANSRPRLRYNPLLGSDDIRVLKVSHVGARTVEAGVPVLSLAHVSLTHQPTYTAISYMWGSRQDRVDLIIDGHALEVSLSLKNMISDLCVANQSRHLWIDAICINQGDPDEKNAQVRRMGDIYSLANYVIAYVKGSDHNIYRASYSSGRSLRHMNLYSTVASVRETLDAGRLRAPKKGLDYERFFNNDYFTRRWIIQEVCLARSVILRCDGFELSMGRLDEYLGIYGARHGYANSHAANICNLRRQRRLQGPTSTLENLLYDHMNAGCTDVPDKVYALLSLSEAGKRHIDVDTSIKPLNLLLQVVHVSWLYEDLSDTRVVSFACFLRQNLEIKSEEFENAIRGPLPLQYETEQHCLLARVQVRGILRDGQIDAIIEDGLHGSRPELPLLRHYRPIGLDRKTINVATTNGDFSQREVYKFQYGAVPEANRHSHGLKVTPDNLWAFSCSPLELNTTLPIARESLIAGMSSAALKLADEIWQFPRTPIALVARPTDTGYQLVARALMLNSNAWNASDNRPGAGTSAAFQTSFEEMIDWVKDASDVAASATSRTMAISTRDLVELMRWVDLLTD